jgi:nucleotide-binding universal stress UspA family protein
MPSHILIATDGSELAEKAIEHGLALAARYAARVTVVTVSEAWTSMVDREVVIAFPVEAYQRATATFAGKILAAAEAKAKAAGVTVETLHVQDMRPAEGILHAAETRGCDLIVMASHGRRGLSRMLLGSQTQTVLTQGSVPVLVVR